MTAPAIEPVELPWRKTPEWVGKTPDSKVPTKVKQRVFLRWGGRCHLTGVKIKVGDDWDVEHKRPLRSALPGEPHLNRETNLRPALKAPHREKTGQENSDGAKADRIWAKNNGVWECSGQKFAKRADPWGKQRRNKSRPDKQAGSAAANKDKATPTNPQGHPR